MQASDSVSISRSPQQGSHAYASEAYERIARANYRTPEERELAIENLKWMSVYAPTHFLRADCRLLLVAMRGAQSSSRTG